MIQVAGLTLRYPSLQRPAVDDLSLSVPAGRVMGFVGPNGAGKTSTLRALAGLLTPAAGTVRVCGADLAEDPDAVRGRVGYLPDSGGWPPGLTVAEALELFAALQRVPGAEVARRLAEVMELVGLTRLDGAEAARLSRGQQQRLGLARCLLHEPDVLLLDEPAAGLDPAARRELRAVLGELGAMGKAVIVSSHVLADVAAACDDVAILEAGRLVHAGPVSEVGDLAPAGRLILIDTDTPPGELRELVAAAAPGARIELDGRATARVVVGAHEDAEPLATSLAAAILDRGHALTRLEIAEPDLEHAFLEVTRGEVA